MFGFEFANPKYFLLLILLVPMIVWYILKEKKSHADLQFSSLQAFNGIKHSGRIWWRHVLFVLELLAIILLVTALARPQSSNSWQTYTSEGIDIALALDVSTSMLARDFTPDRLEAAKEVATKFILERPQDKIGLVVFCRLELYSVSVDYRSGCIGQSTPGGEKRYDPGWNGDRSGFG